MRLLAKIQGGGMHPLAFAFPPTCPNSSLEAPTTGVLDLTHLRFATTRIFTLFVVALALESQLS